MSTPKPVENLAQVLGRLPGVGRRSAERMALRLAREAGGLAADLDAALRDVMNAVQICSLCGNLTIKGKDPCALCSDPRRDDHVICVVEDPTDIGLIERAGEYRGRYHALMGKISPMEGEGVENLRIRTLLQRIDKEKVQEVILALNSDVESDATASFLKQVLSSRKVRVTRLAFGIPAGSEIAYSDPVTLSRAIQGRQAL
ncbi:MAG: recombination protein RecR [Kiritimatiellae bacterium]|nr:recombination protein RecR [Kiritimatiellia bacterium]